MCTLANYVNIQYEQGAGFKTLGFIGEAMRNKILMACNKSAPQGFTCLDGWAYRSMDAVFHPADSDLQKMHVSWWFDEERAGNDVITSLLPDVCEPNDLFLMFSAGNYIGIHNDHFDPTERESGIVAVLLEAPHGCKLLHSGNRIHEMKMGEVILLDDTQEHGAYPINAFNEIGSELVRDDFEHRQQYFEQNCLKFLLIGKEYYDEE